MLPKATVCERIAKSERCRERPYVRGLWRARAVWAIVCGTAAKSEWCRRAILCGKAAQSESCHEQLCAGELRSGGRSECCRKRLCGRRLRKGKCCQKRPCARRLRKAKASKSGRGQEDCERVIARRSKRNPRIREGGKRELFNALEAVSADGFLFQSYLIGKGSTAAPVSHRCVFVINIQLTNRTTVPCLSTTEDPTGRATKLPPQRTQQRSSNGSGSAEAPNPESPHQDMYDSRPRTPPIKPDRQKSQTPSPFPWPPFPKQPTSEYTLRYPSAYSGREEALRP